VKLNILLLFEQNILFEIGTQTNTKQTQVLYDL